MKTSQNNSLLTNENEFSTERLSHIAYNLKLTVQERIQQLQNSVELIEAMRESLRKINENKLSNTNNKT